MTKEKIPRNARRVFKGILWDTYQWRQRMFDGSYTTYETVKRLDKVAIIPTLKGRIMLDVEEQPTYPKTVGIFTGRVERNEKPLDAAKRELLEETGMESKDWELLTVDEAFKVTSIALNVYTFVARNCRKVANPRLEPGERITTKVVDFKAFLSLKKSKGIDPFMIDYIEKFKRSKSELKRLENALFG